MREVETVKEGAKRRSALLSEHRHHIRGRNPKSQLVVAILFPVAVQRPDARPHDSVGQGPGAPSWPRPPPGGAPAPP